MNNHSDNRQLLDEKWTRTPADVIRNDRTRITHLAVSHQDYTLCGISGLRRIRRHGLLTLIKQLSRTAPHSLGFRFATNARGEINFWLVEVDFLSSSIVTFHGGPFDGRNGDLGHTLESFGSNSGTPGVWSQGIATPDAGSTLSLMTLTLMALGLVARRFQRAAG